VSLVISAALFVLALETATTGFIPGVVNPDTVLAVMLTCLGAEVILLPLTFVSGFAHDTAMNPVIAREDV
jgi:ABC-type sulfate transport system permease subunit